MTRRPSASVVSMTVLAGTAAVVAGTAVETAGSAPTGATRVVGVQDGTVRSTVTARGALAAAEDAAVDFKTTGRIEAVYVEEGDHVVAGQLLARLDDTAQRAALAAAKAALAAGGSSSGATAGSSAPTTAAATGGGMTAPAQTPSATPTPVATPPASPTPTATATASPSPTPTPTPTATVSPAPTPTTTATVTPTPTPTTTVTPTPTATATASPTPTPTAPDRPRPTPTPTPAATAAPSGGSAPAASSSAPSGTGQAGAGGGGGGTNTAALASAVRSARAALRATRLRAPVSGTVAQVNGRVGQSAADLTSPFTTVLTARRYTVDVSVGEDDIAAIRTGQRATVTVDAVSGLQLPGRVTSVGVVPDSSDSSSAVTYPVTVALDAPTRRARVGMTAGVRIVTASASGPSVPTQSLRGQTITLVRNGKRTTARVTTGLAGDERTLVTSGVSAGDQVVETSASAQAGADAAANPEDATSSSSQTSPFGGGGPPTGGGAGPRGAGGPPGRP